MIATSASAQVASGSFRCVGPAYGVSHNPGLQDINWTVKFYGKHAEVSMNAHTYRIQFSGARVSVLGLRWSEYRNSEIFITTTVPLDTFIVIKTADDALISAAECQRL